MKGFRVYISSSSPKLCLAQSDRPRWGGPKQVRRSCNNRTADRNSCVVEPERGHTAHGGSSHPQAMRTSATSIVVQDRADAAVLGEQRIAAVTEQVQVERL